MIALTRALLFPALALVNSTLTSSAPLAVPAFCICADTAATRDELRELLRPLGLEQQLIFATFGEADFPRAWMHDRRNDLLTPINYARFYIPRLFPRKRRVLYLDVDALVQPAPWEELWHLDMQGKPIGVVTPSPCPRDLLMSADFNLELLRQIDPVGPWHSSICTFIAGCILVDVPAWIATNMTARVEGWLQANSRVTQRYKSAAASASKRSTLAYRPYLYMAGSQSPLFLAAYPGRQLEIPAKWHRSGLGWLQGIESAGVRLDEAALAVSHASGASVLHFNGPWKPWIGGPFARLWRSFAPNAPRPPAAFELTAAQATARQMLVHGRAPSWYLPQHSGTSLRLAMLHAPLEPRVAAALHAALLGAQSDEDYAGVPNATCRGAAKASRSWGVSRACAGGAPACALIAAEKQPTTAALAAMRCRQRVNDAVDARCRHVRIDGYDARLALSFKAYYFRAVLVLRQPAQLLLSSYAAAFAGAEFNLSHFAPWMRARNGFQQQLRLLSGCTTRRCGAVVADERKQYERSLLSRLGNLRSRIWWVWRRACDEDPIHEPQPFPVGDFFLNVSLSKAIESIRGFFDQVVLLERFDEAMQLLSHHYDLPQRVGARATTLPQTRARRNIEPSSLNVLGVPPEVRLEMEHLLRHEMRLYEHGAGVMDAQLRCASLAPGRKGGIKACRSQGTVRKFAGNRGGALKENALLRTVEGGLKGTILRRARHERRQSSRHRGSKKAAKNFKHIDRAQPQKRHESHESKYHRKSEEEGKSSQNVDQLNQPQPLQENAQERDATDDPYEYQMVLQREDAFLKIVEDFSAL
eukprot:CAMPEP_0119358484 /NCGR_PEP_ID=MMETSP1334-20130426/6680_1 /TAXON_ID=127549 /ORGANISM="Calcidiscus leptoporus, Strain RCC1130" /LENGTH=812 /DNA_ID=CAMNT_0007372997 /DNA_START=223 /DNA_END=2661 /DNA_ORIENTATION=-